MRRTTFPTALAAGLIGTAAMTVAMEIMFRLLPASEQQPLPPRQITMAAAERVGLENRMDEGMRIGATLALHFAYGTIVGSLYAPLAGRLSGPPAWKGMGFGLLVWVASYLGWLPAVGLLTPATRHPPRRNGLMIAAHFLWGAVIACFTGDGRHSRRPCRLGIR